jgi:hypothetical protein
LAPNLLLNIFHRNQVMTSGTFAGKEGGWFDP